MRRNCQRKLLTSCVPCDKVSQALTGTMSVDSHRGEAKSAQGVSQQLQCGSCKRYRARWKYAVQQVRGRYCDSIKSFKSMYKNDCRMQVLMRYSKEHPVSYSRQPNSLFPSLPLILPIKCSQTVLHCSCGSHSAVASVKP